MHTLSVYYDIVGTAIDTGQTQNNTTTDTATAIYSQDTATTAQPKQHRSITDQVLFYYSKTQQQNSDREKTFCHPLITAFMLSQIITVTTHTASIEQRM